MLYGQESNTKTTTVKLILRKKKMLLMCSFGPESEATDSDSDTESVGLSKWILHTISFQVCCLFATALQF